MRISLAEKIKLRELVNASLDYMQAIDDETVRLKIEEELHGFLNGRPLSLQNRSELAKWVFNSIRRLDVLQPLIDDENINEIMVNGFSEVFIERKGKIEKTEIVFESKARLEDVLQRVVSDINRVVNEASPIVDARLRDGSRVNIVLAPVAINGPVMTIRKFPKESMQIKELLEYKALTVEAADFLCELVRAGYNIFICGGTSSGKTTLLNALVGAIPETERIITIEDSAELQLRGRPNAVRLETRNSNSEGRGEISMEQLIKTSLRMRPDRIIVGEVRGRECFSMLQAMNTGHDGSLSTGHANSSQDMISRLEAMVLMAAHMPIEAVRRQICSGLEIMVHTTRISDGTRRVVEISELVSDGDKISFNVLFKWVADQLIATQSSLIRNEKLSRSRGVMFHG